MKSQTLSDTLWHYQTLSATLRHSQTGAIPLDHYFRRLHAGPWEGPGHSQSLQPHYHLCKARPGQAWPGLFWPGLAQLENNQQTGTI